MSSAFLKIHGFWMQRIHPFYVSVRFVFAVANALTTAIGTVYLLGKGLSYTEVGAVWSVALFFSTVLDFPTGNFADIYGRRIAFAFGVCSIGLGNFIYGVGGTLFVFFVASFFAGFGSAQISGSLSSWVVDEQIRVKKQDIVGKIFGDGAAAASGGGILGGILIGLFFTGPLEILYVVSGAIFILIGVFVFMSIPENYGKPGSKGIALPKEAISHYIHSYPLVILSIALVMMYACFTVFLFLWQPWALQLGVKKADLGYLYSIYMAGSAVGAFILGRMSRKMGEVITLLLCFVGAVAGFLTISFDLGMGGLAAGMVLFALGYGGFIPVFYALTNTFIPSSIRASTNSFVSTVGTGGIIVLQVGMGAFIESQGLVAASLCAVVFAVAGIVLLFVLFKRSFRQ